MPAPLAVVDLDPDAFLLRGGRRFVFQHPQHDQRLIKVMRPDRNRHSNCFFFSRFRHGYRIYQQEICEYLRLRSLDANREWLVAPFYGLVETNLGLGLEVARIAGPDGGLAPTLDDLIRLEALTPAMRAGLDRLARRLAALGLVVSDFKSHNLVLLPNGVDFCLVDGLGEKLLLSLRPYSSAVSRLSIELARRRLQRNIDRKICRAERVRGIKILPG
jgi:hypothetical protein